MILATASSCPFCHTVFSVTQEELLACQGWVRCGQCDEIFNASQQAMDVPQVSPAALDVNAPLARLQALPLPESAPLSVPLSAPRVAAEKPEDAAPTRPGLALAARTPASLIPAGGPKANGRASGALATSPTAAPAASSAVQRERPALNDFSWNPFLPRRRDAMADSGSAPASAAPRRATPSAASKNWYAQKQAERRAPPASAGAVGKTAPAVVAPGSAANAPQQRAQAVAALASASSEAARSAHSLRTAQARLEAARRSVFQSSAPVPRSGAAAPLPDFLRRWRQAQIWSQPGVQWAAQALCALLLITAAWQWMAAMPQWMAARFPALQPLAVSFCRHAVCRTNPAQMLRRVADIEVSPGELIQRAPGVYELHATIFNRANLRLAMPSLQLTLFKDREGNDVLLRRSFTPKELGLAAPALSALGEQKITLAFRTNLPLTDAGGTLTPFYL